MIDTDASYFRLQLFCDTAKFRVKIFLKFARVGLSQKLLHLFERFVWRKSIVENIRVWKILETSNRRRREPSKVSGSDGKWENKKKRRDKSGGRSGAWGTREDRRDVSWSVGWARVERMNGWMDSAMKPLKRKHAYSVSRSLPRLLRSSRGTSSRLFRIASLA